MSHSEIKITLESPYWDLLKNRAEQNGTTVEYEASIAVTRELNRVAQDYLRQHGGKRK